MKRKQITPRQRRAKARRRASKLRERREVKADLRAAYAEHAARHGFQLTCKKHRPARVTVQLRKAASYGKAAGLVAGLVQDALNSLAANMWHSVTPVTTGQLREVRQYMRQLTPMVRRDFFDGGRHYVFSLPADVYVRRLMNHRQN